MAIRDRILRRDCGLCVQCREKGILALASEVDHRVPLFQGGTDDDDNLDSLCDPCHKAKSIAERGFRQKPQIGIDGWPVQS